MNMWGFGNCSAEKDWQSKSHRTAKWEEAQAFMVSLARQKMNKSVILSLIKYEILSEVDSIEAVSLLTEDISRTSAEPYKGAFFSIYGQFENL